MWHLRRTTTGLPLPAFLDSLAVPMTASLKAVRLLPAFATFAPHHEPSAYTCPCASLRRLVCLFVTSVPACLVVVPQLAAIGSMEKPPPVETTAVVVGAGMSGLTCAIELVATTSIADLCILERSATAGGVWHSQANSYSRVNSSEPSYRLPSKHRDRNKCHTNHTPAHMIIESLITALNDHDLGRRLHTGCSVEAVHARTDGMKGWIVDGTRDVAPYKYRVKCELCVLGTSRRLGSPRNVTYKGEVDFHGVIARGLNSDAEGLNWVNRTVGHRMCWAPALAVFVPCTFPFIPTTTHFTALAHFCVTFCNRRWSLEWARLQ